MQPCPSRLLSDTAGAPFRGPSSWCLDPDDLGACVLLPDWLSPCFSRKQGVEPDTGLSVFHFRFQRLAGELEFMDYVEGSLLVPLLQP